jgi:hypothetical protein
MSIIDLAELVAYMGNPELTSAQELLCTSVIIPGIQQQLELYLNRPVELVQVRESLRPEADGYIYFTYAPVRKLIAATWSSAVEPVVYTPYTPAPPVLDSGITRPVIDLTAPSVTGSAYRHYMGVSGFPGLFIGRDAYVVADYVAGHDGRNDMALKTALLRVTAREVERQFDTTLGLRSGSLENASESDERLKGWTRDELKGFDRLKRRVIY